MATIFDKMTALKIAYYPNGGGYSDKGTSAFTQQNIFSNSSNVLDSAYNFFTATYTEVQPSITYSNTYDDIFLCYIDDGTGKTEQISGYLNFICGCNASSLSSSTNAGSFTNMDYGFAWAGGSGHVIISCRRVLDDQITVASTQYSDFDFNGGTINTSVITGSDITARDAARTEHNFAYSPATGAKGDETPQSGSFNQASGNFLIETENKLINTKYTKDDGSLNIYGVVCKIEFNRNQYAGVSSRPFPGWSVAYGSASGTQSITGTANFSHTGIANIINLQDLNLDYPNSTACVIK